MIFFLFLMGLGSPIYCMENPDQVLGSWRSRYMHIQIKKDETKQLKARVTHVYPNSRGETMTHCLKGSCQGQSLLSIPIFRDFQWNPQKKRWEGEMLAAGWNGHWYKTYVWSQSPNQLKTRSYMGFLYYTINWEKLP